MYKNNFHDFYTCGTISIYLMASKHQRRICQPRIKLHTVHLDNEPIQVRNMTWLSKLQTPAENLMTISLTIFIIVCLFS